MIPYLTQDVYLWPIKARLYLIVLLSILWLILGYLIIVQPNIEYLKNVQKKTRLYNKSREIKLIKEAQLFVSYQKNTELNKQLNKLNKSIVMINSTKNAHEILSKMMIDNGLLLELFNPSHTNKNNVQHELAVKINMIGHYQQMIEFLKHVICQHYVISPTKSDSTGELLMIKMTIIIYMVKTSD